MGKYYQEVSLQAIIHNLCFVILFFIRLFNLILTLILLKYRKHDISMIKKPFYNR